MTKPDLACDLDHGATSTEGAQGLLDPRLKIVFRGHGRNLSERVWRVRILHTCRVSAGQSNITRDVLHRAWKVARVRIGKAHKQACSRNATSSPSTSSTAWRIAGQSRLMLMASAVGGFRGRLASGVVEVVAVALLCDSNDPRGDGAQRSSQVFGDDDPHLGDVDGEPVLLPWGEVDHDAGELGVFVEGAQAVPAAAWIRRSRR